jgi:hypothetical protein
MREQLTEIGPPTAAEWVREIRAARFEMRAQRIGLCLANALHPAEHGPSTIPTSHAKS